MVYADDSIPMGPDVQELEYLIKCMKQKFEIKEEGDTGDYLGIQIKKRSDRSLQLTQPQLTSSIVEDLNLVAENVKGMTTHALKTVLIHKDKGGKAFVNGFHYRSMIGKLNYLEKST